MRRILVRRIYDPLRLSKLLDAFLTTLQNPPLDVPLRTLAWDTRIPENILLRLRTLHQNPEDVPNITAKDFHIVFSNILFRYPTVKMWETTEGEVFFEM